MRFTVQQAARAFHIDENDLTTAVNNGDIELDNGTLDAVFAYAFASYINKEHADTLGDNIQLPGTKLVYVNADTDVSDLEEAGLTRLNHRGLGLAPRNRKFYQCEDLNEFLKSRNVSIENNVTPIAILQRAKDTSKRRAIADAFLLGDSTVRHCVKAVLERGELVHD